MNRGCLGISNEGVDLVQGPQTPRPGILNFNTILGWKAAPLLNGGNNVIIGYNAAAVSVGSQTNASQSGANGMVVIGYSAQATTATSGSLVVIGASTTTSSNSVCIGFNATGAASSVTIGYQTGAASNTGTGSILIGYQAGHAQTTGINICIGWEAGNGATVMASGAYTTQNTPSNGFTVAAGTSIYLTAGMIISDGTHAVTISGGPYAAGTTTLITTTTDPTALSGNVNIGTGVSTGTGNTIIGNTAVVSANNLNYTTLLGYFTQAHASGTVAIGVDHTGLPAIATVQDAFVLGTANHKIQILNNATGSGTPLWGTNCPAVTVSAPYTWLVMLSGDGSTVYVPAYK